MRITLLALVQLGLLLARLSHFDPVRASYEEELFRQGYQLLSGGEEDAPALSTTGVTNLLRSWLSLGETEPRAHPRSGTQARSNYLSRTVEQNVPVPAKVLQPEEAEAWIQAGTRKIQWLLKELDERRIRNVSNPGKIQEFIDTARAEIRSFRPGSEESMPKAVENMVKFFSQEMQVVEILAEHYRKLPNHRTTEAINLERQIQTYKQSLQDVFEEVQKVVQEYDRVHDEASGLNFRRLHLTDGEKLYWPRYVKLTSEGVGQGAQPGEGSSRGE